MEICGTFGPRAQVKQITEAAQRSNLEKVFLKYAANLQESIHAEVQFQ